MFGSAEQEQKRDLTGRAFCARTHRSVLRNPSILFAELIDLFPEPIDLFAELIDLFAEPIDLFPKLINLFAEPIDLFPELIDLFAELIDLFAERIDLFVLTSLETGLLVPEQPSERRPRIRLAPRPVPIRAFLLLRQPRLVDRIAPILRRRRRTPRPAAVRVPRRHLLGRAPPLFPISVL